MTLRIKSSLALAAVVAVSVATSPASACAPPNGLDLQSYLRVCGGTIVQLYRAHRPNMTLQQYAYAWYQTYLRYQYQAPAHPPVQDMIEANRRLQGAYERNNAEWSRNFRR